VTSRGSDWLDSRTEVLIAALGELGMSISPTAAAEPIQERLQWVASQMRIEPRSARRYLTDDALTTLAREMVFTFANETPGADVLEAPRTAAVPLATVGRCVAGLAEAIHIRLHEHDDIEDLRVSVGQLTHTLSAVDQLTANHRAGAEDDSANALVMLPPGLLNRAARYLEACAQLIREDHILPENVSPEHAEQLATTFAQDAADLRYYAHN
jgi:hypothetical protein